MNFQKFFYLLLLFLVSTPYALSQGKYPLIKTLKTYSFKVERDLQTDIIEIFNSDSYRLFLTPGSRILISNQKDLWILPEGSSYKKNDLWIDEKLLDDILKKSQKKTSKKLKIDFIIIDPGHGGSDPGNIHNGIIEKELNLIISKKVFKKLKNYFPEKNTFLTRKKDKTLSLQERTLLGIEKQKKGEKGIYISIHGNASFNKKAYGIETFFYASEEKWDEKDIRIKKFKKSLNYAEKEETANLKKILVKMQDIKTSQESSILASFVHQSLWEALNPWTLNRGIKSYRYFVIKNISFPSILVEFGFLSHKKEASLLKKKTYQEKIVNGIFKGIKNFIQKYELHNGYLRLD